MKYLSFLTFLTLTSVCFGQSKSDDLPDLEIKSQSLQNPESNTVTSTLDPTVYTIVDIPPSYPGGFAALNNFISERVKSINPKLSGAIFFRVVIGADGLLTDPEVLKSVPNCTNCDKEAIKILNAMPKWTPGEVKGKKVKCYYNIPIKFDR